MSPHERLMKAREQMGHGDKVLVDIAPNDLFAVMYDGKPRAYYDDPLDACDHAEKWAKQLGCKWDVTIQARNAADMS